MTLRVVEYANTMYDITCMTNYLRIKIVLAYSTTLNVIKLHKIVLNSAIIAIIVMEYLEQHLDFRLHYSEVYNSIFRK